MHNSVAAEEAPFTGRLSIANKLTAIIPQDQVVFLDRLCLEIRVKTGAKIRRTVLPFGSV
jgi:hypothetical protein